MSFFFVQSTTSKRLVFNRGHFKPGGHYYYNCPDKGYHGNHKQDRSGFRIVLVPGNINLCVKIAIVFAERIKQSKTPRDLVVSTVSIAHDSFM